MYSYSKTNDPEAERQKARIRMEMMLKQSDVKKNERSMLDAELAMKELKHKQTQLQAEFLLKENKYKELSRDHAQMQAELVKLTHQLNGLGR